jgi:3-hydroxybutyryl-CoA dehydrogenase
MTKARITVIGAGLMGHGIAQVFALAGHDVVITDSFAANLDTVKARISTNLKDLGDDPSAVERVTPNADLPAALRDADYVVEAVLEDLPLKQKLFAEVEKHVRPDTILASNTSVIPITAIMQGLQKRERALGTHWWNPPFLVPLVEVIQTEWTSPEAIAFTMKLHADAGNMRCGARRSRWWKMAFVTPRRSTPSSRRRSGEGSPCWGRWRMPIWWASI